jgi:hypothetical protein
VAAELRAQRLDRQKGVWKASRSDVSLSATGRPS